MIVVDSSAWIEFLRATGSRVDRMLTQLLHDGAQLAVTEIVWLELLAGARTEQAERELRAGPLARPLLLLDGLRGYETAAELYRACRRAGETVHKLSDCLVAVPTIAAGAELLHADADFEILARHTPLRLLPLEG
ncbi:MAG: type II toxin-antitoxin system VapC family toxin [Gaiellaceae bacterium]